MARPLRVEYPGAFYHVISRGNGGERIFRIESDYTKMLERGLAVYLARDLSGRKARDVGEFFGGISGAGITMKYTQACEQLAQDRKLQRKVEGVKEKIFNI